jgi:hypothetical protein
MFESVMNDKNLSVGASFADERIRPKEVSPEIIFVFPGGLVAD